MLRALLLAECTPVPSPTSPAALELRAPCEHTVGAVAGRARPRHRGGAVQGSARGQVSRGPGPRRAGCKGKRRPSPGARLPGAPRPTAPCCHSNRPRRPRSAATCPGTRTSLRPSSCANACRATGEAIYGRRPQARAWCHEPAFCPDPLHNLRQAHAAKSRRASCQRYRVGQCAGLEWMPRFMPPWLQDKVLSRRLGINDLAPQMRANAEALRSQKGGGAAAAKKAS